MPVVAHLDPLDINSLRRILTEPRNALVRQYEKIFSMEGIKLIIEPSAIDMIAEKAFDFKLGARGLRSLCETILTDAMFDLPTIGIGKGEKQQLIIDAAYVKSKVEGAKRAKLKAA
jgi:ATP-dependent Clp protease ATP-binding subunit ClpX